MSTKIKIDIQYFEECPNSSKLIKNVKKAITGHEDKIDYREVLVGDNETAEEVKFRGSPTVLINGKDLLNEPEPERPAMMCRYYQNGLPSEETIKNCLEKLLL